MTKLYYTTIHTQTFIGLIVVDFHGILYYASLGTSPTDLKQLVYKDFNAVKGYSLSLLVEKKRSENGGVTTNNNTQTVQDDKIDIRQDKSELVNDDDKNESINPLSIDKKSDFSEKQFTIREKVSDFSNKQSKCSEKESKYGDKIDETIRKFKCIMEDALKIDDIDITYKIIFGTSLQKKVWQQLLTIKLGEISTYSKIAEELHIPNSARVVGNCVGANRIALVIPCHRVVTKAGKISGYRYGVSIKEKLLEDERQSN